MKTMNIRIGILTVSDRASRNERPDLSGQSLIAKVAEKDWQTINYQVIPDDYERIKSLLVSWCDSELLDVILTTGGTGFSPRDVTPEATQAVIQRQAPGVAEAMRQASMSVTPHAMLSRAVAGIRRHTLIINLPGSPKAAVENFSVVAPVLPHAIELLRDNPTAEAGHHNLDIRPNSEA